MFGENVNKQILEHAKSEQPNESCGYVNRSNEYVRIENISRQPENSFLMADWPDDAIAIVHSHPGGPFYPSEIDMKQQIATSLPWAIACVHDQHEEVLWFGDDVPKAPLIGRGFRHGVTDCYSLIRDFYSLVHALELPEFPREWGWWEEDGATLYESGFKEAGFHSVNISEILPGDVFFASVGRTKTPNHAGVYLGNGLILHHPGSRNDGYDPSRLSVIEPGARWFNFVTRIVRHENRDLDRSIGQKVWPRIQV